MARPRKFDVCERCHKPRSECGRLNAKGFCFECGLARSVEVQISLKNRSGPVYDKWIERMRCLVAEYDASRVPPSRSE